MSHEQAAQTARAIIAAHNKARGIVTDADEARARAQSEASLTPLARKIVEIARRAGIA